DSRAYRLSAQRVSMTTLWPSTEPSAVRRSVNARTPRGEVEGENGLTKPTPATLCTGSSAREADGGSALTPQAQLNATTHRTCRVTGSPHRGPDRLRDSTPTHPTGPRYSRAVSGSPYVRSTRFDRLLCVVAKVWNGSTTEVHSATPGCLIADLRGPRLSAKSGTSTSYPIAVAQPAEKLFF